MEDFVVACMEEANLEFLDKLMEEGHLENRSELINEMLTCRHLIHQEIIRITDRRFNKFLRKYQKRWRRKTEKKRF